MRHTVDLEDDIIQVPLLTGPRLGRIFVTATGGYDFPVILVMGMIVLAGVVAANLLADLLQASINPRIQL